MISRKKKRKEPSKILLEEYFADENDLFVDYLKEFQNASYLLSFSRKWIEDQRPWSRAQVFCYLGGNLNLPGHEVLFKRLYKDAWANHDHELMGAFLVTLDRMVRRVRRTGYRFDYQTRQSWTYEYLLTKSNKSTIDEYGRTAVYKYGGQEHSYPLPDKINKFGNMLFSNRTRNYLRRSVWRYFRYLSYKEPELYVSEMAKALARYEDQWVATPEAIIDNRSLMHACYYHDPNIELSNVHTNVVEGGSINHLSPAPYRAELWNSEQGAEALIRLLLKAKSTLVRVWVIELLTREHQDIATKIDLQLLAQLMSNQDSNVQQYAMSIFEDHPLLPNLRVEQWLDLLDTSDPGLLDVICQSMRIHVAVERLDNSQIIDLTCAKQFPVAAFGFELAKTRNNSNPFSVDELSRFAESRCVPMAGEISSWSLERIATRYDVDWVIDFFDSMIRPMRLSALNWISDPAVAAYDDPKLWARLVESPFTDVKNQLVEILAKRVEHAENHPVNCMLPVWVSVILGIHSGSRTKPKAISQIAVLIQSDHKQAENLMPILAVALRSIRQPEMRSALSAIVEMHNKCPELRAQIEKSFPEIEFGVEVVS